MSTYKSLTWVSQDMMDLHGVVAMYSVAGETFSSRVGILPKFAS